MTSSPVPATLPALRDRQTDRQTDGQTDSLYLGTMILKAMQLMGSYIKTIPKNEQKYIHNKITQNQTI